MSEKSDELKAESYNFATWADFCQGVQTHHASNRNAHVDLQAKRTNLSFNLGSRMYIPVAENKSTVSAMESMHTRQSFFHESFTWEDLPKNIEETSDGNTHFYHSKFLSDPYQFDVPRFQDIHEYHSQSFVIMKIDDLKNL